MLKITDNIKLGKLVGSSGNTGSGGSGGSSNYNDLTNKPSINGVSLNGNKTSAELGVLDLNTTETQTVKGGLVVGSGLAIAKNNIPVGAIVVYEDFQGYDQVLVISSDASLGVPVFLGGEDTFFQNNPKITTSTPLAELPDNAILTKAQVIEATNGSSSGSSSVGSQFPSDRMEDIDTSSLITGSFEYTAPADGWFLIDQYTNEYNLYGGITYNGNWLGNFTVGTKIDFITKDVEVGGITIKEVTEIFMEAGGEYQRIAVPKGAVISLTPSETLNESSTLPNAWFIYSQNNS